MSSLESIEGSRFVSSRLRSLLNSFSPLEIVQISSSIGEKLWVRRRELIRVGGKFAQIALRQTRERARPKKSNDFEPIRETQSQF